MAADRNMVRRVTFAVIAIPVLVGVVWLGTWPLIAVLMAAAVLGIDELFGLAESAGATPFRNLGRALAVLMPLTLIAILTMPVGPWLSANWPLLLLLVVLVVIGAAVFFRRSDQHPLSAIAVTLFGVIYTALFPAMLFFIRHAQWGGRSWAGTALVFFPLVVTWVCDSAAMFGGRLIGGAKLAPAISPGKTRAGGIAGVVGGTLIGALYAAILLPRVGIMLGVLPAAAIACLLSVIGQIGDLAESLLKREAGVKDSSALIPGHGGVLDRLDSLYFVLPAAAAAFHFLGVM
jgi:phosphatidate cytidylyltransferase